MTDTTRAHGLALVALATLACAAAPGCGGARAYTPDATSAREAVEAALSSWQKGGRPGEVVTGPVAVHAVDSQWQTGAALDGYAITDESADGATKRFAVTLKVQDKAKSPKKDRKSGPSEVATHYVVIGRGPVWVYREEDYARVLNMDDNPRPAPKSKSRRR